MEKLLHEQLREQDGDCEKFIEAVGKRCTGQDSCAGCRKNIAHLIANEIERTYIPHPRYDDGELVNEKDFDKEEAFLTIYTDGSWRLEVYGEVEQQGGVCDCVKRPTPKVCDADGVEINVGDTVYNVNSGNGGEVKGFDQCELVEVHTPDGGHWKQSGNNLTHERPVFDAEGVRICKGDTVCSTDNEKHGEVQELSEDHEGNPIVWIGERGKYGGKIFIYANELTHREQDSYQAIAEWAREWANADSEIASTGNLRGALLEVNNRLTALIERCAK